jgi:hypothetical protein
MAGEGAARAEGASDVVAAPGLLLPCSEIMPIGLQAPRWRNWYTQQTQNLPVARP